MRWIGGGLLALSAAAMIAGDAFAAPHTSWSLRFDLLSPADVSCAANAPGAAVRSGRDLFGKPWLTVTGDVSTASITCTAPDGSRWQTALPLHRAAPLAARTEGIAMWRPGAARMTLMLPGPDGRSLAVPDIHRFTRLP